MDRKGKQKLKRYFIVYVIFAVFFTVGMYLITKYEENAKATQIALLLAEHPELEGEIVAIWEKSGTVDFIRDRDDQKIERVVQMLEETYEWIFRCGYKDYLGNWITSGSHSMWPVLVPGPKKKLEQIR